MLKRAEEWVGAFEQLAIARPAQKQLIIMNQGTKKMDEAQKSKPELRILAIELSEM